MEKNTIFRVLDANINRVCEGLRVVEDVIRFIQTDKSCLSRLKQVRHALRKEVAKDLEEMLLDSRDADGDPGKHFDAIEMARPSIYDLLRANFLRIEEGLRTIEELLKLHPAGVNKIEAVKSYRFEIYSLEKKILLAVRQEEKNPR